MKALIGRKFKVMGVCLCGGIYLTWSAKNKSKGSHFIIKGPFSEHLLCAGSPAKELGMH